MTLVTTFFLIVVFDFAARTSAKALPVWAKSTATQNAVVTDLRSTALINVQGKSLDVKVLARKIWGSRNLCISQRCASVDLDPLSARGRSPVRARA